MPGIAKTVTNTLQIVTVFLAQIGLGSAVLLPFFPLKITGKSFIRFYYGFIIFFFVVFLICLARLNQFQINYLMIGALAAWIWILSFGKSFTRNEKILLWGFAFCALVILFNYPYKHIFHGLSYGSYLLPFALLFSGTIFLCFHVMNMIFGHWYLVNRELPVKYLIKTSRALIVVTYLRILAVGVSVFLAYDGMTVTEFDRLIAFTGHGIFFWARILAGLGIPLLVAHLSYASAKIRSNQSATGILYAGTVFVLMGEMMGLYLYSLTGITF